MRSFSRKLMLAAAFIVALGAVLCAGGRAVAGDYVLPVPNITIYPGDIIKDAWLVDRDFSANPGATRASVIQSRAALVGKVARRTLLPGVPIPANGVNDPRAVRYAPEKILVMQFPELMPPTLISRDRREIEAFRTRFPAVVMKPLYGNGGAAVFKVDAKDVNFG